MLANSQNYDLSYAQNMPKIVSVDDIVKRVRVNLVYS